MKSYALVLVVGQLLIMACAPAPKPQLPGDPKNAIRLKARVFVPEPGLDKELKRYFDETAKEERVHVLVQFVIIPGLQERKLLEDGMKVLLLDPVPERAFFVAMPTDLSLAKRLVEEAPRARWVGVIAPAYKVAPWLLSEGVPDHARRPNGMAEVIVQFFGDVAVQRQEQVLNTYGARILTRIVPVNGWRIILDQSLFLKLAAEDVVKWIEEIPAPPEDDNDGVRSATGVNADALHPPTVYNITGNGVVVGQWEGTHASLTHGDFTGRITLADPPIPADERTNSHNESVTANAQFDNGEAIYRDIDDSGNVSAGDVRATAVGGFAAGSVVAAGDADTGTALIFFNATERFANNVVAADFVYTTGEGIYLDNDYNVSVSVGDNRLTPVGAFAAGSVVAAGDADVGQNIFNFPTNPHYHATHVAGTVIGSGAQSAVNGGAPNQWKGVAPSATLRSYSGYPISATGAPVPTDEYTDAATNGVTISTNSWGSSHCHQVFPPNTCYDMGSQYYDSIISGRKSDGTPSGLTQRILIVGSAGNRGAPERHTESVAVNGQYDAGETIYIDSDDNGSVSAGDLLSLGPAQPVGTAIVNFNLNEMHDESVSLLGTYNSGEGVYMDADASRTVSVGDTRIIATGGFPAGSVVVAGNADVGINLRQFRLWGNVRIPNSAKNTIEVANITSNVNNLSPSSSRGPTDDGRVRPDLAGPGDQAGGDGGVTSTWPGNLYNTISGTSMATPAVAGSAALLTEWYKTACVTGGPTPDALKAILIHSTQDLTTIPNVGMPGSFTGPDFAFGYGRTRVKDAVDLLPHHRQGTATAVGDIDYTINIGAMQPLKVTLVWDDPAWTANAATSAVTGILQNDLDLLLIAPDGTQYTPWIVNAANPFATATRPVIAAGMPVPAAARDRRNPVEQVVVDNAMAGTWTIRVTASTLNLPPQSFTLVSEALPPQAGPCASTPAADVWMMDNSMDIGTIPSSGRMWLSPDIWNRPLLPDGMTTHDDPEFGQVNYLYTNIRNGSATATVRSASIDVWLAPASVGLVWPTNFTYVGRISVPNLGPSEVRQVGPLEWNPPPPTPSDHYCFYVRVTSPQDPIIFAETADVGNNARNSNNIVWRNINVVDLMSSRSVTFLVRNIEKDSAEVDLVFQIPQEFLSHGKVFVRLSPELEKRWSEQYRRVEGLISLEPRYRVAGTREEGKQRKPGELKEPEERLQPPYQLISPEVTLRGFRMESNQVEPVSLTFSSEQQTKASYEVHVVERIRGQIIGGILYIVRTGHGQDR